MLCISHLYTFIIYIFIYNCFHFFSVLFFAISPVHASTSTVDWTCQSFELARVGGKTWKHETWTTKRVVLFWKASHCLAKMRIRGYADTKIHGHTVLWARDPLVSFTLWNTLEKHFDSLPSHTQNTFRLNWVETLALNCWTNRCQNYSPEIIWTLSSNAPTRGSFVVFSSQSTIPWWLLMIMANARLPVFKHKS